MGLDPTCPVTACGGCHTAGTFTPFPSPVLSPGQSWLMLQPWDGAGSKVPVPCHHLHEILGKNSALQGWSALEQAAQRGAGIAVHGNIPKGCGCGAWGQGLLMCLAVLG